MTTPESRTVEEQRIDGALAAIERADQAVSDLCSGKLRWEMRVPAEPDHDPDLIISNALLRAKQALAAAKEHGLVIGEGELDVERLERALVAEIHVDPDHGFPADFTGRMLADLVAREYERLRR